jgi:hypothetical protein
MGSQISGFDDIHQGNGGKWPLHLLEYTIFILYFNRLSGIPAPDCTDGGQTIPRYIGQ